MKKSENIVKTIGQVNQEQRESLIKQKACTFWFTGLSASGKTTLAYALEKKLFDDGKLCYVLDGDNIRHGLNSNLGFSAEDRSENIRRIAEVSKLMNDAGIIVLTSFISPFISDRELAKKIIGEENYKEIYVSTSLHDCEQRDPKGLYKKARCGEIIEFTGISSPYEPPSHPYLKINTANTAIQDALQLIITVLK
ncbi:MULTISPECIES: adenylyl-sulfate kinase [Deefgea]|uniref:Adenylyl-sulfate kinase n=1 Tax=Deefgea chitinilytica TaxID=570276 RepID=A0ABS2C8R7_9NEIS|nr:MULTISPECIES: adenylyl-sulfate kinase [Deefgea]MBM5570025.1 adenylyl-sulfate kinase [Deefgea chitinilytica]MBM9887254.1 adenylyl-sulfate kinase [Deefgea sp. CFH1-16]